MQGVAHTVGEEAVETLEHQVMGHVANGPEFRDMCDFLEKIILALMQQNTSERNLCRRSRT
jgi:hypothetical protein